MAEIVLGIGCSHGPLLSLEAEQWDLRAMADRTNNAHAFRDGTYTYDQLERLRRCDYLIEQNKIEIRKERQARCQTALDTLSDMLTFTKPDVVVLSVGQAERKLQSIEVLYAASIAYFNWKLNYSQVQLYKNYLKNAEVRYNGVSRLIENGDKSAIDSIEAGITVRSRKLNLEDSELKLAKSKLELSNYLWLENNVPLEIQDNIIPEDQLGLTIQETLKTNDLLIPNTAIENHPKINALQSKIAILEVDRKLKATNLLPKIDLGYYYLSEPSYWNSTNFENFKIAFHYYYLFR